MIVHSIYNLVGTYIGRKQLKQFAAVVQYTNYYESKKAESNKPKAGSEYFKLYARNFKLITIVAEHRYLKPDIWTLSQWHLK